MKLATTVAFAPCRIPAGMRPPTPLSIAASTRWQLASTELLVWGPLASRTSRLGPTTPSVPPAARVWQEPQFVWKRLCAVRSEEETGIIAAPESPRTWSAQNGITTIPITATTPKVAHARLLIALDPPRRG